MPMSAFYRAMEERYSTASPPEGAYLDPALVHTLADRSTLRRLFWAWLQLRHTYLDLKAAFSCPVCSTLPHGQQTVIIDAISLGFQAHRLPPYIFQQSDIRKRTVEAK